MASSEILDRFRNIVPPLRDVAWYADRATRLWKASDLTSAMQVIKKAEPRFGSLACIRLISAKLNLAQKNVEAVRADLVRAVKDPKITFAEHIKVSEIYQSIDDDDSALTLLNKLGEKHSLKPYCVKAYYIATSIYARRGETFNALDSGIKAAAAGGELAWNMIIKMIRKADLDMIERCRVRMREMEKQACKSGNFYKLMTLFDSRVEDREAMLKHMTLGAKTTFELTRPDIPWLDDVDPLLPSFLIIGAMKCGSTSLHDQISQHPLCLAPMNKELQFFQHPELDDQWYLNHFPRVSPHSGFFTGEASPGYFRFDIIDRVKNLLPNVKLLLIKRDPVDRAISHFRHNVRQGTSKGSVTQILSNIDNIQAALLVAPDKAEDILLRRVKGAPVCNAFLLLGCYEILMRRWYAAFPQEQILELNLKDYRNAPQETSDRVFAHLGVDSIKATSQRSNVGNYVKSDPETKHVTNRLREFYDVIATLA